MRSFRGFFSAAPNEVLEPAELRAAIADEARRVAGLHRRKGRSKNK
jgi:hypothetical protein